MNELSLFSGVGGGLLGSRLLEWRTVCAVEMDPYAGRVLAGRQEGTEGLGFFPIWDDVRTFDGRAWRSKVDIIAAGYPCTPFSLAGRGLAEEDPRHLWPDVRRVISEVCPRLVVLENVEAHIKRGLDRVLCALDELGFHAEWGVYGATQAGAPHRRNRVFVLAYTSCVEMGNADCEGPQGWNKPEPEGSYQRTPWPPGPEGDWSDVPKELWPATESELCVLADGLRSRVDELRALGNAVCPQQAALALTDLATRIQRHHYGI